MTEFGQNVLHFIQSIISTFILVKHSTERKALWRRMVKHSPKKKQKHKFHLLQFSKTHFSYLSRTQNQSVENISRWLKEIRIAKTSKLEETQSLMYDGMKIKVNNENNKMIKNDLTIYSEANFLTMSIQHMRRPLHVPSIQMRYWNIIFAS